MQVNWITAINFRLKLACFETHKLESYDTCTMNIEMQAGFLSAEFVFHIQSN